MPAPGESDGPVIDVHSDSYIPQAKDDYRELDRAQRFVAKAEKAKKLRKAFKKWNDLRAEHKPDKSKVRKADEKISEAKGAYYATFVGEHGPLPSGIDDNPELLNEKMQFDIIAGKTAEQAVDLAKAAKTLLDRKRKMDSWAKEHHEHDRARILASEAGQKWLRAYNEWRTCSIQIAQ